jgi:hypothetical protein
MISFKNFSISKDKAELLASRLKERDLLKNNFRVCHYQTKNNVLIIFFRVDGLPSWHQWPL